MAQGGAIRLTADITTGQDLELRGSTVVDLNGKKPFAIHFLHRSEPFGDGNILCDGGNAIVDDQDIVGSKGVGRKKGGITYKNGGHDTSFGRNRRPG